jgi:hypothetical protein
VTALVEDRAASVLATVEILDALVTGLVVRRSTVAHRDHCLAS